MMPSRLSSGDAQRGVMMVLVATVAWSFSGVFTRLMTIDICTAITWRSFFGGVFVLAIALARSRMTFTRNILTLDQVNWYVIILNVIAQAATTAGLFLTSVAHVAVIYAFCPFIAALISWFWLDETVRGATVGAIVAAMVGVTFVVVSSLGSGSLVGDLVALVMTASFAMLIVLPKAYSQVKVSETMLVSAFLTFAIFVPFSRTERLDLGNLALAGIYGSVNLVLAYNLFIRGARHIPAATSGLIATLEIVLSPLWVWLFFQERVDGFTLAGSCIVATAVIGHLLLSLGRAPAGQIMDATAPASASQNG